jgi:protein FRG1
MSSCELSCPSWSRADGQWDQQRQRVYAAPLDIPEAPEGANDLTTSEVISSIEPSNVNHVWVVSRLSGSEDVMSLRTSSWVILP